MPQASYLNLLALLMKRAAASLFVGAIVVQETDCLPTCFSFEA